MFAFFLVPFVIALILSWHKSLGDLRKSMLNPMLVFAGYVTLVAADFAYFEYTGRGKLGLHTLTATKQSLATLEFKYVVMLLAMLAGIATAFIVSSNFQTNVRYVVRKADTRLFFSLAYAALLVGWLVTNVMVVGALSLASSSVTRLETSGNAPLFLTSLLLFPAICFALCRQRLVIALTIVVCSVAVLLLGGSRTRILVVVLAFLFYLYRVRGISLPRWAFFGCFLFAVVLSTAGLNYRLLTSYDKSVSWDRLLTYSSILDTNDISFAETNVALSKLAYSGMQKYPGEDLVGFVIAVVPRSVLSFKPPSGAVKFTRKFDERRWRLTKSALTVGGISEIEYDYPFAGAMLVIALLGFAWAMAFLRVAASPTIVGFAWTVNLYFVLYIFLKGDLQIAGQSVASFAIYSLVAGAYARIRAGLARPARPHAGRQPTALPEKEWRRKGEHPSRLQWTAGVEDESPR